MSQIEVVSSSLLAGVEGVRHAFFTRKGGSSQGLYESLNVGRGSHDELADVTENRARCAAWFGAEPEELNTCFQIHSTLTHVADGAWGEVRPQGDAVVTRMSGLVCGVLSADCAPVLIVDPDRRLIAAAHAGWRGALDGVVQSAVDTLSEMGGEPSRMLAAVGPCIGPQSYEVGEEFEARFAAQAPGSQEFFRPGEAGRFWFDLPAFVLSRLATAGIERAEWTGQDTVTDEARFFSNRRAVKRGEGDYGRLLSAIMLA